MTSGERIKAARKKVGLTQEDLGKRLGVSGSFIAQYETNNRNPKLETLRRIAIALGTTVSELVEPSYWSRLSPEELTESGGWDTPAEVNDLEDGETIEIPSSFHASATLHAHVRARKRITAAVDQMTTEGQSKVADYAEDILPRYRATRRQEPGKAPPAATEGTDTTPGAEPAEGPPEGE